MQSQIGILISLMWSGTSTHCPSKAPPTHKRRFDFSECVTILQTPFATAEAFLSAEVIFVKSSLDMTTRLEVYSIENGSFSGPRKTDISGVSPLTNSSASLRRICPSSYCMNARELAFPQIDVCTDLERSDGTNCLNG
jgi:hypothetical protein